MVMRFAELPLPDGAVRDGEVIEVSTVANALRRLWALGRFKSKDVAIGMGGAKVFARDLAVPSAPISRIRESLPFQVQELLPLPVAEAILDFYPISEEVTSEGKVISGLLVAGVKAAVSANAAAVTQAGLRPVHVDLVPFALSRAYLPLRAATAATALIDIGSTATNVVVAQGGVPLFVRIVPGGGDAVTASIGTRLQIPFEQAEAHKRRFGLAVAATRNEDRPIIEAIYAAVWELIGSIRDTLSYFTASGRVVPLDRVLLAGGGTQLPGLTEALSETIGLPVSIPDVTGAARLARGTRIERRDYDSMSTAFGLALGTSV